MPYLLILKKQQNLKMSSAANYRWRDMDNSDAADFVCWQISHWGNFLFHFCLKSLGCLSLSIFNSNRG